MNALITTVIDCSRIPSHPWTRRAAAPWRRRSNTWTGEEGLGPKQALKSSEYLQ